MFNVACDTLRASVYWSKILHAKVSPVLTLCTWCLQCTLGTNPMSVAAPAKGGDSFILDMATSAAALGKVGSASKLLRNNSICNHMQMYCTVWETFVSCTSWNVYRWSFMSAVETPFLRAGAATLRESLQQTPRESWLEEGWCLLVAAKPQVRRL